MELEFPFLEGESFVISWGWLICITLVLLGWFSFAEFWKTRYVQHYLWNASAWDFQGSLLLNMAFWHCRVVETFSIHFQNDTILCCFSCDHLFSLFNVETEKLYYCENKLLLKLDTLHAFAVSFEILHLIGHRLGKHCFTIFCKLLYCFLVKSTTDLILISFVLKMLIFLPRFHARCSTFYASILLTRTTFLFSMKLDAIISVDSIMEIKGLPMASFEQKLWNILKYKECISESDRRKVKIFIMIALSLSLSLSVDYVKRTVILLK